MTVESLTPHIIENLLRVYGFGGVKLRYNTVEDYYYLIFLTIDIYQKFISTIIDTDIFDIIDEADNNVFILYLEPLQLSVCTKVHNFDDWCDWERFFHKFFTLMDV